MTSIAWGLSSIRVNQRPSSRQAAPVVPLPRYPWQRQRYWLEPRPARQRMADAARRQAARYSIAATAQRGQQVGAERQHPQERDRSHVLGDLVGHGQQQPAAHRRQQQPQRLGRPAGCGSRLLVEFHAVGGRVIARCQARGDRDGQFGPAGRAQLEETVPGETDEIHFEPGSARLTNIAKAILEGRFAPKDRIRVDAEGGQLVFTRAA